jgi:hypothetical protein
VAIAGHANQGHFFAAAIAQNEVGIMEQVILRIDLKRLQARLSQTMGRSVGEVEARRWLSEQGFACRVMGWCAQPSAAHLLEPQEILDSMSVSSEADLEAFWLRRRQPAGQCAGA